MKKSILIFCLVSVLTAQVAFAEQPSGKGISSLSDMEQSEAPGTSSPPFSQLEEDVPPSDETEENNPTTPPSESWEEDDNLEPKEDNGNSETTPPETENPPTETDPPEADEPDIFHPEAGDKVIPLPVPQISAPGMIFAGWNTDPDAFEGFESCCLPNENLVLYPIWQPDAPQEDDTEPPAEETPDTNQPQQPEEALPDTEQTPPSTTELPEKGESETPEPTKPSVGDEGEASEPAPVIPSDFTEVGENVL